jgi:hypothetical protein
MAAAMRAVKAPESWAIVVTPNGGELIAGVVVLLLLEVNKFIVMFRIHPTPTYASTPC